jgi:uncharacterized protein (AIM24 family)
VRSQTLNADHTVQPSTRAGMTLENTFCLRYAVDTRMVARQGAMVAYRGDLRIQTKGQGLRKLIKRTITREGVALMEVEGQGDMWLADQAKNVSVLTLDPEDSLSITGRSVLCFDPSLNYEIRLIKGAGMPGGGLFNCVFDGQGSLAVTSHGQPIVIPVTPDVPVLVDTDAVVGWSAKLETAIHRSEGFKSLVKGGSGEAFQLRLEGDGFVIVQPSEGPIDPKAGKGGVADTVGEMLAG